MPVFELVPLPPAAGETILPLALVKAQVSLVGDEGDDWDDLLGLFRDAALAAVESYCMIGFSSATRTWKGRFPAGQSDALSLGVGPVTAVSSIAYLDSAGASASMSASDVMIGTHRRIWPKPEKQWPSNAADMDGAVTITFTAGFASGAAVPVQLKQAAMFLIGFWFENRAAIMESGGIAGELPLTFTHLCDSVRGPLIG